MAIYRTVRFGQSDQYAHARVRTCPKNCADCEYSDQYARTRTRVVLNMANYCRVSIIASR